MASIAHTMSESVYEPGDQALVEPEQLADVIPLPSLSPAVSPNDVAPSIETDTIHERPRQRRLARVGRVAGKVALAAVATGIVTTAGAATAITLVPASIEAGPGISATVEPIRADYSGLKYGPTLGIPKMHIDVKHIPIDMQVGLEINIDKLDTHDTKGQDQALAAMLHDPQGTLGEGVTEALAWRAGEGGAVGLSGLLVGAGVRHRRRKKHAAERAEEENRIELLELRAARADIPEDLAEETRSEIASIKRARSLKEARSSRHKIVAALTVPTMAINAAYLDLEHITPDIGSRTVILSKDSDNIYIQQILAEAPVLDGAFVTGDAGFYVKKGILQVIRQLERVNQYWGDQATALVNTAIPEFLANNDLSWLNDPNYVGFVHLTDVHDNRPFMKYFLPQALQALAKQLNIRFVVNTGDQANFSGRSILDDGVRQREADALPILDDGTVMKEVEVDGNHDDDNDKAAGKAKVKDAHGKTTHPIISLNAHNDYTVTIDGLTFVGSADLNRTTGPHGTKPSTKAGQIANDAKQGQMLARVVHEVYQKTGRRPIVLVHEPEAGYASVATGDARLVLDGHMHHTSKIMAYRHINEDGTVSVTLQQTIGSASGDGPNDLLAIYNKATTRSAINLEYVNVVTGDIKQIMISVDPNGGIPTITLTSMPSAESAVAPTDDSDITDFAQHYDSQLLGAPPNQAKPPVAEGHH